MQSKQGSEPESQGYKESDWWNEWIFEENALQCFLLLYDDYEYEGSGMG